MHWGGISYFVLTSLFHLRYLQVSRRKVNRLYLLKGGTVARFQFNSGSQRDVPISGISFHSYMPQTSLLHLLVSGDKGQEVIYFELCQSQMINLPIIYAMTRGSVSAIQ